MVLQREREQALKDYKITIEYKHLKQHAPGGVYLIPSFESMRLFYGVIFLRRGPYTNGIFKFQVMLPEQYNDHGAHPVVFFDGPVFPYNPFVDGKTGELNIKIAYPTWDPQKHYLITLLTHLKKIFYVKSYDVEFSLESDVGNQEALQCWRENIKEYIRRVNQCVKESQARIYTNAPEARNSTIAFHNDAPEYQILRQMILSKSEQQEKFASNKDASSSSVQHLSRTTIFDMIGEAMNSSNKTAETI